MPKGRVMERTTASGSGDLGNNRFLGKAEMQDTP